jgi:hypothetical protein
VGDFAGSTQFFDWNPGIEPSGLFWTMPIRDRLIWFDLDTGRARFRAHHLSVPDYGTFANSIEPPSTQTPPIPSHVSFDTRWRGGGTRTPVRDEVYDFAGVFIDGDITIDFTAKHDGDDVIYRSDDGPQIVVSGGVGRERNGVFFP